MFRQYHQNDDTDNVQNPKNNIIVPNINIAFYIHCKHSLISNRSLDFASSASSSFRNTFESGMCIYFPHNTFYILIWKLFRFFVVVVVFKYFPITNHNNNNNDNNSLVVCLFACKQSSSLHDDMLYLFLGDLILTSSHLNNDDNDVFFLGGWEIWNPILKYKLNIIIIIGKIIIIINK